MLSIPRLWGKYPEKLILEESIYFMLKEFLTDKILIRCTKKILHIKLFLLKTKQIK